MANLSADAKRVAGIVDEIEGYNQEISILEYKICDVPDEIEDDIDDLAEEQKRLQNLVNTMTNDLKFDDDCTIEYDDHVTQVRRNGVLWLECRWSGDKDSVSNWVEYQPSDVRNRRVAFLTGFAWDRVSDELLDEVMTFMKAHGFDAVK